MFNGKLMHERLADKQNRCNRLLDEGRSPQEVIDLLYRAAVCRPPTEAERQAALADVAGRGNPSDGLKDVCWALLNTDEFLTQH
jgi:hypothetical protein